MTSQVQTTEKGTGSQKTLSLPKRLFFIALILSIQLLYIPTSERIAGGFEPKLLIDIFPIWPVWVLPYVLCYPLWLFGFAWATFKMEDRLFRSFVVAFLVTCTISVCMFIFFPTYVRPAELTGSDIFTSLLRFIHENAGRYSALPSGHIYITALLALFYSLWYPRYKSLWILILVIVSLSTLFTAQHYVLDILGGLLVAWVGYYVGLKWTGFFPIPTPPAKNNATLPPPS